MTGRPGMVDVELKILDPRLGDSIKHAVAEGCLEAVSSAPSPGDG